MPLISIIIPAYNAERFLRETCRSLLAQTCPHWEALIIDDGSQDATADVARAFCAQDGRFHLISQANAGVSAARNAGIDAAHGDFIAFLDADDMWEPSAVAQFLDMFTSCPEVDIVWSDAIRFDSVTGKTRPVIWKNYLATGDPWLDMLIHHYIPISGVCCRASLLTPDMRWRTDITHGEDRDFLLRILRNHTARKLGRPAGGTGRHAGTPCGCGHSPPHTPQGMVSTGFSLRRHFGIRRARSPGRHAVVCTGRLPRSAQYQ